MDQVLPGYAEECNMLTNEIAATQFFCYSSLDEFSPTYDFSTNGIGGTTMQNDHMVFPGEQDTLSIYLNHRHKGMMAVDEGERRQLRRERNKVAASKCRNKRREHVRILLQQSNELESRNKQVEVEILHLQAQIKELETLLDTHRCFPGGINNNDNQDAWRK